MSLISFEQEIAHWIIVIALVAFIIFLILISFLLWKKTTYLARTITRPFSHSLVQLTIVNFLIAIAFFIWIILIIIN